jgi:hypothetical protein
MVAAYIIHPMFSSDSLEQNPSDLLEQQNVLHWDIFDCLETIYDILGDLEDIRLALCKGKNPSDILSPPFDPLKTIGKYC